MSFRTSLRDAILSMEPKKCKLLVLPVIYGAKDHRITHKQEWSQNALYSQMQYFWGNAGKVNGNLLTKALCDSSGAAYSSFHYTYY